MVTPMVQTFSRSDVLSSLAPQQGVREVIARDSFCAAEVEIFRAVSRWTAANPESDAAQLLSAVRLPLIRMQVRSGGHRVMEGRLHM